MLAPLTFGMSPRQTKPVSRREVLQTASVGAVGAVGLAVAPGTVSANCPCECVTLGKITESELPDCPDGSTTVTKTLDGDLRHGDSDCTGDKDVDVEVTVAECKGNEVTCVDLKIVDDNGACKCADDGLYLCGARVKGGPTHAIYDCGDVIDNNQDFSRLPDACAPINPKNRKRHGISHIEVQVCVFPR